MKAAFRHGWPALLLACSFGGGCDASRPSEAQESAVGAAVRSSMDPSRPLASASGPSAVPEAVHVSPAEPSAESEGVCPVHVVPGQQRGMCYAHSWERGGNRGYGSSTSQASLEELAALGLDWVSLTPFGFERSLTSTEVRLNPGGEGESDDRVRATIAAAHELGLRVMLKPHIWIHHGEWQGEIAPAGPDGWDRWFESYEAFIGHYADLAESAGADMLVVGVELGSSTRAHPERWREIIDAVRGRYRGPLVYAANWDEAAHVAFWDALDYIGVQMYAPLADSPDDGAEELRQRAAAYLAQYEALSQRVGRPIILTEVGFKSLHGGAVQPHIWPEQLGDGQRLVDEEIQAAAYCAILQTFGQSGSVAGIFWWKWFTDPDTAEEGPLGFSPRGKLAEDVLRAAYRR